MSKNMAEQKDPCSDFAADNLVRDVPVHPELVQYLGYCLHKSALRLRRMVNEAFADYGLIASQLGMLLIIRHNQKGKLTQNGLAESMNIDKATMVKLIDGLENLGIIRRVPGEVDRRVKHLYLTEQGEQLMLKLEEMRKTVEAKFLNVLNPEEQKLFCQMIAKLVV